MLATAAFATALGAASAMDLDPTSIEDVVDPRILLIINGSNFNTTNLQFVLAGVALAALTGLLMALCLYALSLFFSGNDDSGYGGYDRYDTEPDSYATYSQGSRAFQARSLGGAYDAIKVLYLLEQAFEKMNVMEVECQKRAVCEAHQSDATQKFGQVATDIQKLMGSVDESTVANDEGDNFVAFRNAARRGANHQDCEQAYATKCPKGLREFISAEAKY